MIREMWPIMLTAIGVTTWLISVALESTPLALLSIAINLPAIGATVRDMVR